MAAQAEAYHAELEAKWQLHTKVAAEGHSEEIKALEEKIAELQEEQSEGGAEVSEAELQGALEAQKELATRVAVLESEQAASEEELEKKLREAADEKETLAAQAQAYHAELEAKWQLDMKVAAEGYSEEIKALEEKIAELQEERTDGFSSAIGAGCADADDVDDAEGEVQSLKAELEAALRKNERCVDDAADEAWSAVEGEIQSLKRELSAALREKETLAAQAEAFHAELEAKWQLDMKVAAEGYSEEIKALEEKIAELQEERTDGFSSAIGAGWDADDGAGWDADDGAGWDADDADDAEGEVQSLKAELEAALRENERCVDELQERPDSFGSAVGAGCPDADDAEDEARSLKRELRQALVENRRCEDDFLAAASSEEKQNRRIAALLAEQEDLRRELDRISADVMQPASRPKFPL